MNEDVYNKVLDYLIELNKGEISRRLIRDLIYRAGRELREKITSKMYKEISDQLKDNVLKTTKNHTYKVIPKSLYI